MHRIFNIKSLPYILIVIFSPAIAMSLMCGFKAFFQIIAIEGTLFLAVGLPAYAIWKLMELFYK